MRQLSVPGREAHLWEVCKRPPRFIALAGSAGSLEGFRAILSRLPREFPYPIMILQHREKRRGPDDALVQILSRSSVLKVAKANQGDHLVAGNVYVGPPDRHISVTESLDIELTDGPCVNWNRPSADWLFDSLARRFGAAVIAIVLSGALMDGAAGVVKVKMGGGQVIVQDPQTALFKGMPTASIATGCADFVLPIQRIADALITLTMVPGATELFSVPLPAWARS